PLSLDHPPAVVAVAASSEVRLQHGGLRFLQLKEQGVGLVPSEEERDPALRPDAAHADDLVSDVDDLESVEQVAPIVLKRPSVAAENGPDEISDPCLRARLSLYEFRQRHDQRRLGPDPGLAVD